MTEINIRVTTTPPATIEVVPDLTSADVDAIAQTIADEASAAALAQALLIDRNLADLADAEVARGNLGTNASNVPFTQDGTGAIARTVGAKIGEMASVLDFGAVGDGVANDTAAIQAAVDASVGKVVIVPDGTYLLNSNVTRPAGGVTLIVSPGAYFTGAGRMWQSHANNFHDYTGTFFYKDFQGVGTAGRGDAALSADFTASADYAGNGCAGFFSTETRLNAEGFYWAINPILELNPGLTGNGIACEVDLDNFAADGKGQGILMSGIGNFNPEVGIVVQYEGNKDWQTGIRVRRSQLGMRIDGAGVVGPVNGLEILDYPRGHIKMRPAPGSDALDYSLFLANEADTGVQFGVTNRGGVVIGLGGREITSVRSVTTAFNVGLIGPGATFDYVFAMSDIAIGDEIIATPLGTPAAGIVWSAYCSGVGSATIRLANVTGANVDPDGGSGLTWRVSAYRYAT